MEKKMNNKGFSLVELLIVIAIMVILVAVLAPQYLRYVEKSRVSSDTQTTVELINVMQVLAADPDVKLTVGTDYSATGNTDGTVKLSDALKTELKNNSMMDDDAMNNIKYQSSAYKDGGVKIELKYDSTAKIWKIVTAGVDSSGSLKTGSNPPAGS